MPRYLTPALAFDRSAIMRSAWLAAHALAKSLREAPKPFRRRTTARAEFANALRRVWETAKSERALAIWAAERDAAAAVEDARRAALPARDRQIEDARHTLMLAEHADRSTAANNAAVGEARALLRTLQIAA